MTDVKRRRVRELAPGGQPVSGWEVVWAGDTEADATIIAGSLRNDGISAVVRGSNLNRHARTVVSLPGGWAVLVPGDHAAEARDLLEDRGEPGVAAPPHDLPLTMHLDALKLLLGFGLLIAAVYLLNEIVERI